MCISHCSDSVGLKMSVFAAFVDFVTHNQLF